MQKGQAIMRSNCMRVLAATAVFVVVQFGAGTASAAQPQQPPAVAALIGCRDQSDAQARLRCYDAAVGALANATAAGSIVVVDREDVRRTRRSLFGFSVPKLPFFSGDKSQGDEQEEIVTEITSVRGLGYGKWQIDLGTAGVWRTTEASPNAAVPGPGERVRIRQGTLGSYFISVGKGRAVRGLRVR
jgi:hypothetical protein